MNYKILLKGVAFGLLICSSTLIPTESFAQGSLQQELDSRGLTLEQVQNLARRAGVNPNDPQALARFARQNGVPEATIQEYLVQLRALEGGASTDSTGVVDLTGTSITTSELIDSTIDTSEAVSQIRPIPTKNGLEYFGYRLFGDAPDPFKPSAIGPVDAGYVIGPEDQLRLSVWGATEFQYDLDVDAEGRIFIPTIGQLTVAGQSLADLRKSLKLRLSKSYSGLVKDPPTVYMDLAVTRFKPIEVFVLGEVENPGGYTFSSRPSLFNILYAVGGPTINGSLRDIKIIREGKVIASVDMYELLLKGMDSSNTPIISNDRIFIAPRVSEVSINGPVMRPAIYELKKGENIADLVEFAGGLRPEAYGDRFQVNRITPIEKRVDPSLAREVLDFNLNDALSGTIDVELTDGDQVSLFNISSISDQYVRITGAVNQPGTYGLDQSISNVKDLIMKADSLRDDALTGIALITRTRDDSTKISFSINLALALENDPSENLALERRDELEVFSNKVSEIENKRVTITGAVRNTGEFEFAEGMTLESLLLKAGGFTERAFTGEVEITRTEELNSVTVKTLKITFPLIEDANEKYRFYSVDDFWTLMDKAGEFSLKENDRVYIRNNPEFEPQTVVTIKGEVNFPGTYTVLREKETLADIIVRAGGLTVEGYAKGARLRRKGENVVIELDKILKGNKDADVQIQDGDELFVPEVPNAVLLTGNVALDGYIKYVPGAKFSYYLGRAGGLQPDSYKYVLLTQANGSTYRVKRKGLFKHNPVVDDGATINVIYEEPKPDSEKATFKEILGETTALLTSTLTIILLVDRLTP